MQEMIELSKQSSELPETPPKQVMFKSPVSLSKGSHSGSVVRLFAGPAQFGKVLQDGYEVGVHELLFNHRHFGHCPLRS